MLVNQKYNVSFLIEKIGPYVELNPNTGNPRLIRGLNDVWLAIDEFGGIGYTARHFCISEKFTHQWIDDHYIPVIFAWEISNTLGYSRICELQQPTTGYYDSASGNYWPWSWAITCAEFPEGKLV